MLCDAFWVAGTERTIWDRLDECVHALSEPFRASEIVGWFRRHYPDVKEQSLRAHIQGATSNASSASRAPYARHVPLITRIDHGLYRRVDSGDHKTDIPHAASVRSKRDNTAPDPQIKVPTTSATAEWHHESNVQAAMVTYLATTGWSVTSVADTATRARGLDIVARKNDTVVGVEVKGYPSRYYADAARAGQEKPTQPATQARVWYAGAVLAAMRLRSRDPTMAAVIALPDFPTYRSLHASTEWSLDRCDIQVWWISENGVVTVPGAKQDRRSEAPPVGSN